MTFRVGDRVPTDQPVISVTRVGVRCSFHPSREGDVVGEGVDDWRDTRQGNPRGSSFVLSNHPELD